MRSNSSFVRDIRWGVSMLVPILIGTSRLLGQDVSAGPALTSPAPSTTIVTEADATAPSPNTPPPTQEGTVAPATAAASSTPPHGDQAPSNRVAVTRPVVIPYQEQVFQVSISLGVAPDSGMTHRQVDQLLRRIQDRLESRIGLWWNCRFALALSGEPIDLATLEHRAVETWTLALEPTPIEKHFALTLDRAGTAYRLCGVEWDRASQSLTPIQQRQTFDQRLLADLATDLILKLFRPLVSVEVPLGKTVEMRIRGGELLPPDGSLLPFQVGSFVTPFARHLDKNRVLKRLQMIPWTVIQIEAVERSYLRGQIVSAFASPISGSRRRVEMLAIQAQPTHPETRLQVIPRRNPDSPMAGYRVELLDRLETQEDKVADRVTLRTDRNGEIVIPADLAKPLKYLIVYSGTAPLAKAPLIPGLSPRLVLEAPDDTPRLNVEAETELLQSELVDLVARREVLMARARGAAKKQNWDQVTDLEKQVLALPGLQQFQTRIETLRNPAIQTAKRNKDKAQEARITRMCKQISEMATEHLDPVKLKEFTTELEEERKAQ